MKTIEQIANELRLAWNEKTGTNLGQTWESASTTAKHGYIAVARKAVELCSPEKTYRDLLHDDTIKSRHGLHAVFL